MMYHQSTVVGVRPVKEYLTMDLPSVTSTIATVGAVFEFGV